MNENTQADRILLTPMEDVLHNSMIPYAEYVIMDRAIPRVEDGLKPVQRRILYTMYELGLTADKPTRKSARIVGDCLGKFHPHGDTSVYGALVRMGQDFAVRQTLVDGQGNFGSIDGDSPAAMRYTEARMTKLAMELLRDIEKDTVDFTNNFDDSLVEPITLPGRFPNLLVNGAYGIAVGLATNIPTHNLGEVIDGVMAYIDDENISLQTMMEYVKAPDFASGGYLIKADLENAYASGKGRFFLRAKVHFEKDGARDVIVVTELPYGVLKAPLTQKIIALREQKKGELLNIAEVVDESDLDGMRVAIKLKKDCDKHAVLADLFKKTDLMISFNANMVAIADGKPKTLSLVEIIRAYVKYQIDIIVRRSKFEYDQAKKREHILDGLVIAVQNIDEVIEIIKTSKNTPEAKSRLMSRFELDGEQAQAILDLRLAKITSIEVYKLEKELEEVKALIARLSKILKSRQLQKEVLKDELQEIKDNYSSPRKTIIVNSEDDITVSEGDEALQEQNTLVLLGDGKIKRFNQDSYKEWAKVKTNYAIDTLQIMSNHKVLLLTSLGNSYLIPCDKIEYSTSRSDKSFKSEIFKSLKENEQFIAMFSFEDVDDSSLIFFTKLGMIKKTLLSDYKSIKDIFQAIKLKEEDEVVTVQRCKEGANLFFATKNGMALMCDSLDVPMQGRVSMGVKGINLSDDDYVVSAFQLGKSGEIVAITKKGMAKRMLISNIPQTARFRKGVRLIDIKEGDSLLLATRVKMPYQLILVADSGNQNVISTSDIILEKRELRAKPIANLNYFAQLEMWFKRIDK